MAATPKDNSKRAWNAAGRLWAAGKRQIVEGITNQLKDLFFLKRHRAKTLEGLLARPAAKICAYTCVSEMLGYSPISITLDIYSHLPPEMQEKAAEALEEMLS